MPTQREEKESSEGINSKRFGLSRFRFVKSNQSRVH